MEKVYGLMNSAGAIITFQLGKASVRCTFKNGNLSARQPKPATLRTDNVIVQKAIENSEMFGGRIKVLSTTFTEAEKAAIEAGKQIELDENVEKPVVLEEKPEIETLAEAANLLKSLGASPSAFRSVIRAKESAAKFGLSFPNLK